jgi:hypothetical protein
MGKVKIAVAEKVESLAAMKVYRMVMMSTLE